MERKAKVTAQPLTTGELTRAHAPRVVGAMSNDADELEGFIRTAEAVRLMGLGTSQFYKCRKTDPDFPRPVHLGYRTVVYSRREVQLWIRAKLEAARQAATR